MVNDPRELGEVPHTSARFYVQLHGDEDNVVDLEVLSICYDGGIRISFAICAVPDHQLDVLIGEN